MTTMTAGNRMRVLRIVGSVGAIGGIVRIGVRVCPIRYIWCGGESGLTIFGLNNLLFVKIVF